MQECTTRRIYSYSVSCQPFESKQLWFAQPGLTIWKPVIGLHRVFMCFPQQQCLPNTDAVSLQTANEFLNHINMNVMRQNVCVHFHFILWRSVLVPCTRNKTALMVMLQNHGFRSTCIPWFHLIVNSTSNCYCSFQGNWNTVIGTMFLTIFMRKQCLCSYSFMQQYYHESLKRAVQGAVSVRQLTVS